MRAFGPGAAGPRTLVVVVTISAIHNAARVPGRQQTGNARIFPDAFNGMKRCVGKVKLQPRIGLHKLPRNKGAAAVETVGVTAETQFVFVLNLLDHGTAGIDPANSHDSARSSGCRGGSASNGMRIVAIFARHMARGVDGILGGIMNAGGQCNRMHAGLVKFSGNIFYGHRSAVAGVTILLIRGEIKQTQLGFRRMRSVTIFTAIGGHGCSTGMRPWILSAPVPGRRRGGVDCSGPLIRGVTIQAQSGRCVVHHEEISILVIMRIVT